MNVIKRLLSVLMIAMFTVQSAFAAGSSPAIESTASLDAKQQLTSFLKDPKLLDDAIALFQALRNDIEDETFKKSFMVQAYSKKMGMHPKSFENYPSFLAWVDANGIYDLVNDENYAYTFRSVTHRAAPLLIKKGQVYPTPADPQWTKIIASGVVQPDGSMPDNWAFTADGFVTVSPKKENKDDEGKDTDQDSTCPAFDLLLDSCKVHTVQELMEALRGECANGQCNLASKPTNTNVDEPQPMSTDLDDPALVEYALMWPSIYNGKGDAEDERCSSYFEVFGDHKSYTFFHCHQPTPEELLELKKNGKVRKTLQGVNVEEWAQIHFPSIYKNSFNLVSSSIEDHKRCTTEFNSNCGAHKSYMSGKCKAPTMDEAFDLYMAVRADASIIDAALEPCPSCPLTANEVDEDSTGGNNAGEKKEEADPTTLGSESNTDQSYWSNFKLWNGDGLNNANQSSLIRIGNVTNTNSGNFSFIPVANEESDQQNSNDNSVANEESDQQLPNSVDQNKTSTSGNDILGALGDTWDSLFGHDNASTTPSTDDADKEDKTLAPGNTDADSANGQSTPPAEQRSMTLHSGWKAVWKNGINKKKDNGCQKTYSELAEVGFDEKERFDNDCVVPSGEMLTEREWLKSAP